MYAAVGESRCEWSDSSGVTDVPQIIGERFDLLGVAAGQQTDDLDLDFVSAVRERHGQRARCG